MRFAVSILGAEVLAIELGPAGEDGESEAVTGTPSSVEFGFAPRAEEYWGEDDRK